MFWPLVIVGFIIFFSILLIVNSYRYRINEISIPFSELPQGFDGTKIFFISDIHRRKISRKVLQKAQEVGGPFQLVLIGGDLTEHGVPLERTQANLRALRELGQTYFVWGNHDERANPQEISTLCQQEGVRILSNEAVQFETYEGESMWLMGVEDVCTKRDRLELALMDTEEEGGFRILLSHVPTIVRKIKPEHKISLVLSGHTHGGQICLPWIGPITGAVGELFPKEVAGLYELKQTKLFISRGYGTVHLPFRFLSPPEVVIITLKKEE